MRSFALLMLSAGVLLTSGSPVSGALLVWSEFDDISMDSVVQTSNLDGSNVQIIASSGQGGGVAVDNSTGIVYYASGSTIRTVNVDGSNDQLLADVGSKYVWNMEIYNGALYFNSDDDMTVDELSVQRINLDGTGLVKIAAGETNGGESIAIHEDSGQVYFTHYGTASEPPNTLKTVDADGLTPPVALANQPDIGFISDMYIDNNTDLLYHMAVLNGLYVSNLDGSNLQFISEPVNDGTLSVYVDSPNNTIYWGSRGTTSVIGRMDLDGSNQQTLTGTDRDFYAITVFNATSNVPEPGSMLLLGIACSALLLRRSRKRT